VNALESTPNQALVKIFPSLRPMHISEALRVSVFSGLAAAALATTALAQAGDKVIPGGQDKPVPGQTTVIEETLSDVVVQIQGGGKTPYKREGARIQYGPGEAPFSKALTAIGNADYPAALAVLEPLKPEREIFVPRRLYLLARCLEGLDRTKEAEDKYAELVQKFENNYYTGLAIRSLIDIQIKNKNFAGAVSTADKGIAIAQKLKLEGSVGLVFRTYKATAFEAQDKLAEAEAEYRAIAAAAGGAKDSATAGKLANVGLGRIAARQGDFAKARTLVEPVLKDTDPSLLGPAYSAMGEALLNQGVKESSLDKIREAAIENFLRVIVQFPPSSSEPQDCLETAMYGYARAAKSLSEAEKEKEKKDFWVQEGIKMCKDFQDRFKSSRLRDKVSALRGEFKA
jgi:tetratricopeptide (TPR) repeat protein